MSLPYIPKANLLDHIARKCLRVMILRILCWMATNMEQGLRHVRHILRYMHGISCSIDRVAH